MATTPDAPVRASNVARCGCSTDSKGNTRGARYQDQVLGTGMRFFTTGAREGTKSFCTVCGSARK